MYIYINIYIYKFIYIYVFIYVYIRTHTHTYTCKHKHACTSRCASIVTKQYIYNIYNGDPKIVKGAHNALTFSACSKKSLYTKCLYIYTQRCGQIFCTLPILETA